MEVSVVVVVPPVDSTLRLGAMSSEAKKRYLQLVQSVDAILRAHDPLHLLTSGAPSDEYEGEARAIVGRLARCADVEACREAVADVFEESFGSTNRSEHIYSRLAAEVFALKSK